MKEIIFYRTAGGHCPVEKFLDSLTPQQAKKAAWVMQLVEELDPVPSQYFRKLVNTDDIWEIRVIFSGNIFRFLGFFHRNKFVVLVHGFQKKTQETPQREILTAEDRKRDYLKRGEPI